MQTTTLDRWWPVTYDFGLIKSDLDCVVASRSEMYEKANLVASGTRLQEPLEKCLAVLEPLSTSPTKELFLETAFGWTAYFSNGCRGSDPFLPMLQLSKTLGVTALRACICPASALYQGVILEVYDTPQAGGNEYGYRRSIAATNDGGRWVFEHSGTPYPFEDTSKFDARRKSDRFTSEMFMSYLENLGIPGLSDDLLQANGRSRGFLLAREEHAHLPSYSLDEAKSL